MFSALCIFVLEYLVTFSPVIEFICSFCTLFSFLKIWLQSLSPSPNRILRVIFLPKKRDKTHSKQSKRYICSVFCFKISIDIVIIS